MNLDAIRQQLIGGEAIRLTVYDDATGRPIRKGSVVQGHPTIGVGRNLAGKGLSMAETMYLLDNDIAECLGDLVNSFPWFERLDPVRQRVLLDMRFNLGPKGFRSFRRMLQAVGEGRYSEAADHMQASAWFGQVKTRGVKLVHMMRKGACK